MLIAMGATHKAQVVRAWEDILQNDGLKKLHQRIQHPTTYIEAIRHFGKKADVTDRAEALAQYLEDRLSRIETLLASVPSRPKVYYAMGKPLFYLNGGRLENQLVETAGGTSVNRVLPPGGRPGRTLTAAELNRLNPEVIFISAFISNTVEDFYSECLSLDLDIDAVKNRRIYVHPSPGWDFGSPRWILGLMNIASILHPDRCAFNLTAEADAFYRDFYGIPFNHAVDEANNDVELAPADIFALGAHWQITDTYAFDGRYYHGEQGTVGDFDMRLENDAEPHPERQDRTEISLSADYASFFKPAVTWFSIDTKNAKTASSSTYELDGGTYYYYNESDELRDGLELMVMGNIGRDTSFKLSWTRMLTNETTSNGVTTDANGVNNPENLYSLTLSHRWRAYRASLSIKKTDEWSTTRSAMRTSETDGLGDYTRVDANIKRDVTLMKTLLTVTLYGRNLLDENYATRYVTGYYPDRGRVLGIQVSWAF